MANGTCHSSAARHCALPWCLRPCCMLWPDSRVTTAPLTTARPPGQHHVSKPAMVSTQHQHAQLDPSTNRLCPAHQHLAGCPSTCPCRLSYLPPTSWSVPFNTTQPALLTQGRHIDPSRCLHPRNTSEAYLACSIKTRCRTRPLRHSPSTPCPLAPPAWKCSPPSQPQHCMLEHCYIAAAAC
jgi:hypothetical protein